MNVNKNLAIIVLFFFVLYSLPQLMRPIFYTDNMIGLTSYYHVRMAETLGSGQFYDSLSFGGRPYTYPPLFHLILAFMLPLKTFLLPLCGAIGIILCYYLARELGHTDNEAILSCIVLGFIPGYLYISSHINPRLVALLFLVGSYYFLLRTKKDKNAVYFSAILYALTLLTHTLIAIAGLIFAIFIFRDNRKEMLKIYAVAGILSAFAWYFQMYFFNGMPIFDMNFYGVFVELYSGIQYFIFESATVSDSIGAITILLAVFAVFKLRGKNIVFLRDWLLLGVILALFVGNRMNEELLFPIALLAGKTLSNWGVFCNNLYLSNVYKNDNFWRGVFFLYTILIGTLAAGALMYFPPSPQEYSAMTWIGNNTPQNAVIMGYWEEGHWITGIADRKDVIDAYAEYAPQLEQRYEGMLSVIEGSDVNQSLAVLQKYNVSYIYFSADKRYTSGNGNNFIFDSEFCNGFAYQTRYPYFQLVYSDGPVYVFKVDYSGKAAPTNICAIPPLSPDRN